MKLFEGGNVVPNAVPMQKSNFAAAIRIEKI